MSSALMLVPVVAAVGWAVWWVRSRRDLSVPEAIDAPWYLFPLARYALYRHQIREAHADLWKHTGMYTGPNDNKGPLPAWRCVFVDKHDGTWRVRARAERCFPQGKGEDE